MYSFLFWISSLIVLNGDLNGVNGVYKLQERYNWKVLDFAFPNQYLKEFALSSGHYKPKNALPVGVEHWGNRLFVTIPRWRDGIPATLTYINMDHNVIGSPELIPYPDWRFNKAGDCANSITSTYRIKADICGRLWVLDVGTLGIGNETKNVCPYAVNVFDLYTNTRIRHYELRQEDINSNTFIANIIVDIGKNCDDAFAYFSDELGYGLIVYSWEKNRSWRFSHSYFFPDPLKSDFNIAGLNFQWGEEGIFGMSLSPLKNDSSRILYFSPLASHRQFSISTHILHDENRVENSYHDFIVLDERGLNSHTTAHDMSEDGIELFGLIDQNAIGCWNSSTPYNKNYHGIVDHDNVGLVFPADVKIDEEENVWVLSDRMPVFLISELDYNDINFRIYTAPLHILIEGTICNSKYNSLSYNGNNDFHINKINYNNKIHIRPVIKSMSTIRSLPSQISSTHIPIYMIPNNSIPVHNNLFLKQTKTINYQTHGPHLFPTIVSLTSNSWKNYVPARKSQWWNQETNND